jgi:hypothetical protein
MSRTDGRVFCRNDASTSLGDDMGFFEVPGLAGVRRVVASSRDAACALTTDAHVWCWGDNRDGQTGSETVYEPLMHHAPEPEEVVLARGARSIAAGGGGTCVVLQDGRVVCWGPILDDDESRMGNRGARPHVETALGVADEVFVGQSAICARRQNDMRCRGLPGITELHGMRSISIGRNGVARRKGCTLDERGLVFCFDDGPLRRIEGLPPASAVVSHVDYACATSADALRCWGTLPDRAAPTAPRIVRVE